MGHKNLVVQALTSQLLDELRALPIKECIASLNHIREELQSVSPFAAEPVDCVLWVEADSVSGNDYNPNTVAAPEMELLATSIMADGYTQPIVAHDTGENGYVVVDGFHRNRLGKENAAIRSRIMGYLPVVKIRASQGSVEHRMASTIRHNRARGKHGVNPMTDLVSYLAKKGWDDEKISKQLGMDLDEVLRFRQISGLSELFSGRDFSEAWEMTECGDGETGPVET